MPRVITISGSDSCETQYRRCLKKDSRKRCKTRLVACSRRTGQRTRRPPGVRLGGNKPRTLVQLAKKCRHIVEHAERDLGPLTKEERVDVCADQVPDAPLEDIRSALIVAGLRG
jgi:hypothetical protein